MARFYPSRTFAAPFRSVGGTVLDAHGVDVATVAHGSSFAASALADLLNAGHPVLKAAEDAHDAKEAARLSAFLAQHRTPQAGNISEKRNAQIAGRMTAEGARDLSDMEIARTLADCVAGPGLVAIACALRDAGGLKMNDAGSVVPWHCHLNPPQ